MVNKISLLVIIAFAIGLLTSSPIFAEIEEVKLQVNGLACPFCVYGLEKKLKKAPNVSDVKVHLKEGSAILGVTDEAVIDFVALNEAVKDAGFTLKDISVRAVGFIADSKEGFILRSSETGQQFLLFESDDTHEEYHDGKKVMTISAALAEKIEKAKISKNRVRVEGNVHAHKGLPPGLLINHFEELES